MLIIFILNVIVNTILFYVLLNIGDWEKLKREEKAKEREMARYRRSLNEAIRRNNQLN